VEHRVHEKAQGRLSDACLIRYRNLFSVRRLRYHYSSGAATVTVLLKATEVSDAGHPTDGNHSSNVNRRMGLFNRARGRLGFATPRFSAPVRR
jgi:hypothetical protein